MAGVLWQIGLLCVVLCSVSSQQDDLKPRMSQVDVLRSESFLVRWVRPRRVDGELHRYEVKAFINSLEGPVILRSTSGDEHSLMMRGLDPYTNYFIQVTAVTSSGRSPPSDPLSVITDTAPSSSPLNLVLTKITPRSARLEWEPPEKFYKKIDSYRIDMRKDGILLRSESTKDTKIDLSDLEPGQLIVLRVVAVTRSLYSRKEYQGEFAQLVFTTPPEATTSSRLTNTPPVRRTTNTPTKHSTPLSGRTTTRRPYKPRGTNSDRIASRTAVAKLNWLRSGTREQVAQTKLAKLRAEVAKLEKVKLELEIAKLSPNCLKPMLGSDKVFTWLLMLWSRGESCSQFANVPSKKDMLNSRQGQN